MKETCLINVFLTAVPYLVDGVGNNGREKVKGCEEQRMVGTPTVLIIYWRYARTSREISTVIHAGNARY